MKLVCLSSVIFVGVFHEVYSGILMERIGDTLGRIKCKTQSIGNRLFHRGQNENICDERQDFRPQGGQNQYEPFNNRNNHQRVNGNQIWIPFTNREQGSWGQQNTNHNGGYTHEPNSNNYGNGNIADSKREESTATNILNQNVENQSQNCTVIDVRSDNNNQIGVPNNCTQGGRRFLTAIKVNCPAGEIADKNGVCREMYRR